MQRLVAAARDLPSGRRYDELRRVAREQESMIETAVRYWALLTGRGWGVANVGVHIMREAGRLLDNGDELAADEHMATWFDRGWMDRTIARVESMVDGTPEGRELFTARARLLSAALSHHERLDYAASITIVLTQVEGITSQVTAPLDGTAGKLFFTKSAGRQADVVDSSDLASIEASLAELRTAYSASVPHAQAEGHLSRHGILHGQELAFDTRVNSAKCWSLLDVLVQWAMPRGRERDAKVAGQRGSIYAGSQDVDDRGRRLDDREFKVTGSGLYEVCSYQSAYAQRRGRFDAQDATTAISDEAMSNAACRHHTGSQCTQPPTVEASGLNARPLRVGGWRRD